MTKGGFVRAAALSLAVGGLLTTGAAAAPPTSIETDVLADGTEVTTYPLTAGTGLTLLSTACPNTTVCIYQNGDYGGQSASIDAGGSGGTEWFATPFPVRSAKNKFNNRRVLLGNIVGGGDIGERLCIKAGENRPGPFAERSFIKIGASGFDPNCNN
jgi:hypothetical protein